MRPKTAGRPSCGGGHLSRDSAGGLAAIRLAPGPGQSASQGRPVRHDSAMGALLGGIFPSFSVVTCPLAFLEFLLRISCL